MDINDFKKYAIPKIETGKMLSIVKKAIKEEEYAKQDQYEDRKELYKPIVEMMDKEIDEISNLRTEFNQTAQQALMPPEQSAIMPEEQKFVDLNAGFSDADFQILKANNLPIPSDLFMQAINDNDIVGAIMIRSGVVNQKLGGYKGAESKKKTKKNSTKIKELDEKISVIKKYKQRINIINEGKKAYTSGTGYTHKERNAYKIQNGQYGNLKINMPKLVGQLKLIAYKNGKKVYNQRIDFDTIDLLTKKFNSQKKYSDLSKRVFNNLNSLSGMPIHKSSKKFKKIGAGVVYYNNPQDLLSRLELLGGSIQAGNNGVKNEFSEIAHVLSKLNIISNDQLKKLLKNYIM